jgi:hypothetical protein
MHDKMMKMLMGKKKQGKTLSEPEKKAKLTALGGMRDMAHEMMSGKLKNLKKVTVASNSKPGLKEGLSKAEDILNKDDEDLPGFNDGGKVGQLPSEFDRDEDHLDEGNEPRNFSEGGMLEEDPEHESSESPEMEAGEDEGKLEQIVEEVPEDSQEIDKLIQMLEEKKQKLSK